MEIVNDRDKDFFYSAAMLNTKINYRTLKELSDQSIICNYRDIADKELLKEIAHKEHDLSQDTVLRVSNLLESYGDVEKIVREYKKIAMTNRIEVVSVLDNYYPYNWKELSGMPKVFYAKGNYSLIDNMTLAGSVAVVGSRNPSKYAQF